MSFSEHVAAAKKSIGDWFRRYQLLWIFICGACLVLAVALVALLSYLGEDSWWNNKGSEVVRNYGLLFAALGAGGLAVWRSIINQRQAHTAEQGQITDRYTEAVKMLADDNPRTRVGAVYALARIAQDSIERDHIPVMEVLTEFIRNPPYSKEVNNRKKSRSEASSLESEDVLLAVLTVLPPVKCPDIQAALKVIAERSEAQRSYETDVRFNLDLARANLSELGLDRAPLADFNLDGALFDGADLHNAVLNGSSLGSANFIGAKLFSAQLIDAFLGDAHLSEANLVGANLVGANLGGTYLFNADLSGANLINVVNLEQAQIETCRPSARPRNIPSDLAWPFVEMDDEWVRRY